MSLWKTLNMEKPPANIQKLTPLPCLEMDPVPLICPFFLVSLAMDRTHTWSALLLQVNTFY